jgi:HEAT repeat protein
VVGLRVAVPDSQPSSALKSALARIVEKDDAEAVRIAAAHALCKWGERQKAMPVLTAALKSPQPSKQLQAALALEDLGEPARPLLPLLKQLSAKSSEYVQRVTAHTVKSLEQTQ